VTHLDDLSRPEQYERAIEVLAEVTDSLMDTVKRLDDTAIGAPSLCAGWTRGHVLTHVARNADALRNLVTWARTGAETPMYPSRERRDADIEAGSGRSAAELESDVEASAERFLDDLLALDPEHLTARVSVGGSGLTAHDLPLHRAREVAFHHVDLDAGYTFADVPPALVRRALAETGERLTANGAGALILVAADTGQRVQVAGTGSTQSTASNQSSPAQITGRACDLLAWTAGRSDGSALDAPPQGLPQLPPWG